MIPTFEERVAAWCSPPVDDVGYISSAELLRMDDEDLVETVRRAEKTRYLGWRNYENRWRDVLGLDSTHDKFVLDYGCGIGIEALQYARAGNAVVVADISLANVRLGIRVLELSGYAAGGFRITEDELVNGLFGEFEVIHCAGVLHHIPDPKPVVEAMHAQMVRGGELRLMVYSDEAWRIACGTEPPAIVETDPGFEMYWTRWDSVGGYADWYNDFRLRERFGKWFKLVRCEYLTEHREYLGAVMVAR